MKTENIPFIEKKDLLTLYDRELREQVEYPEALKEISADVVRFTRKAPAMNFVSYTYVKEAELDRVIKNELAHFIPMKQPFTWKVFSHDPLVAVLKEKLTSHGFVEDEDRGDIMLLDLMDGPEILSTPVSADIRQITDPEGLKDIIDVLDKVWGGHNTWVNDRLGGHLKVPGYLSVYVAYVNDQPASIGWTYFPKGHFATLFAGSTLPEYRNQGLYTSILSTRLKEIQKRGYQYAVVEAGDMSRPIVEKHGFYHFTTTWDYIWQDAE
jgi:GNAT superfamily N-acetyltransferase